MNVLLMLHVPCLTCSAYMNIVTLTLTLSYTDTYLFPEISFVFYTVVTKLCTSARTTIS